MEKTIEERAKEIADRFRAQSYFDKRCNDLVGNITYQVANISATEQKQIDIEKAWDYIQGIITYALSGGDISHITKECVAKAMEEIETNK